MLRIFVISLILILGVSSICCAIPLSDPDNLHNLSISATHAGPKSAPLAVGGTDQICVFCHTPHSAVPDTPLWGRLDPNTMGSFPLYGPALEIKKDPARTGYNTANLEYPSGASRMCLSCHDGATAIGILRGGQTIAMPSGSEFITKTDAIIDLSKAHPISFNYNADVILNVLNPAKPGQYQLPPDGDGIETPLDGAGQMQCTTCHDPHEDTRAETGVESLPFWRNKVVIGTTLYDDVCNSCHVGATPGNPPHLP